jgi:hypothetical protein
MTFRATLSTLAAAVTFTSLGAADPTAPTQGVVISLKILPDSVFVLTPRRSGVLAPDSGTITGDWRAARGREVVRDGQTVGIYVSTWTLAGRRGTLTIRERRERTPQVGEVDDGGVAVGTWTVVRGTGVYGAVAGGGSSGHVGRSTWYARLDGLLTAR